MSQRQSQCYYTTSCLPPINSSWSQAPWESRSEIILQLNPCSHSLHITSSLTRGWVCLLWTDFIFVKRTYAHISIGLHSYGKCLFFPGIGQSDKSDNLEWRTSHWILRYVSESRAPSACKPCSCLLSSQCRLQMSLALNAMTLSGLRTLAAILFH
jgi:hypothetical protein